MHEGASQRHIRGTPALDDGLPKHPPSQPVVVGTSLFRAEILDAFRRDERASPPLRTVSLPRGLGIGVLLALTAAGLVLLCCWRVEVTATSRGVLRAAQGVKAVVAQTNGTIIEVLVDGNDSVQQGQVIARIDSSALRSEFAEAEAQLRATREEYERATAFAERHFQESVALLDRREQVVARRASRFASEVQRLERNQARAANLVRQGLVDASEEVAAQQLLDRAMQALLDEQEQPVALQEQREQARSELNTEQSTWRQRLDAARARRDSTALRLADTELRAPYSGRISGLRVVPGQTIESGASLARVVPDTSPNTAILFVPERERAFLREGASVRIELDQLPAGEFGELRGFVGRIALELADATEVHEELGEHALPGAFFRVDAVMQRPKPELNRYLRSGMLVTARIKLREQRVLTLLFEPLRRWFD